MSSTRKSTVGEVTFFETSTSTSWLTRRVERALILLLVAFSGVLWVACEEGPPTPLTPLGPDPNAGGDSLLCFSDFDQIRTVGEFSGWDIGGSPVMVQGGAECAWSAVVKFDVTGETIFKFLTGASFEETGFVGDESVVLSSGQEHDLDRVQTAGGTGNAIKIEIPVAGCYEFQLFEDRDAFRFDEVSCSSGGIAGFVDFEGVAQPPFPKAFVRALQDGVVSGSDSSSAEDGRFVVTGLAEGTYELSVRAFGFLAGEVAGFEVGESIVEVDTIRLLEGCVSAFDSIQVVGEITDPQWTVGISPHLQQVEGCRWEAEVDVEAGEHFFKLVTNGAFDNDYGGDETLQSIDSTIAVELVSGEGTALLMEFPFSGSYRFVLDEEASTLRVEPGDVPGDLAGVVVLEGEFGAPLPVSTLRVLEDGLEVAVGVTSSDDGSFRLEGIDQGLYDVRIEPPLQAPTHVDTLIADVGIGGGTLNLGQVLVRRATGSITGEVGFVDLTGTPPPALIEVRLNGELAASAQTTSTATTFSITGLKPAQYSVLFSAEGFVDSTLVADVGAGTTDLGKVDLERLICASFPTLESMKLGGARLVNDEPSDATFTWNPGFMPVMTRVDRCLWTVEITAQFASVYRIKFITNGDFVAGDPPAFGGDDEAVIPADSTASVIADPVPGTGNALRIEIAQTGIYQFTLDLDSVTFTFTRVGDLPEEGAPMLEDAIHSWWQVQRQDLPGLLR